MFWSLCLKEEAPDLALLLLDLCVKHVKPLNFRRVQEIQQKITARIGSARLFKYCLFLRLVKEI